MNALLATGLGTIAAIVLLIPVAAYEYRRDGKLGPGDLAILLSGAVYGLALWTYTLLPMPEADTYRCAGRQTQPFETIRAIGLRGNDGLVSLVHDPAFLQVALNVLLFVPLGFYVRKILGRGVVVATVLGLGTSLLIELTQTTGVWGVFDCAYRLFDVDDLIVNTMGATAGSLLAALVVKRRRGEIVLPTTISIGRRWVGMICDVLFIALLGSALAIGYRAVFLYGLDRGYDEIPLDTQTVLQWGIPALVELASVLFRGRTVGEWVVDLKAVGRPGVTGVVQRLVKYAVGVGPLLALGVMTPEWSTWALAGYVLVTAAAAVPTKEHRGLSHEVTRMQLTIDAPARD